MACSQTARSHRNTATVILVVLELLLRIPWSPFALQQSEKHVHACGLSLLMFTLTRN